MSLNKTKRFSAFSRSLLSLVSLSLLSLPLISSTSFPSLVVSDFLLPERKVSKENQSKIEAIYKQIFGDREKLLNHLSLSTGQQESLVLTFYDFLEKSELSSEALAKFFEISLSEAINLFQEAKLANLSALQQKSKRYLSYTYSLLEILSSLREKFSYLLRGFVLNHTNVVTNLLKLAPLIDIGIKIASLTTSLTEFVFSSLEFDFSFLSENLDKLFSVLETIEIDSKFYREKTKEFLEKIKMILDPALHASLVGRVIEWDIELIDLRERATELELVLPFFEKK